MTDRPTSPRIEPVGEPDAELQEILAGALTHDGTPLNIFGVLGRHPKLLKRFNLLGGFLLNKGLVPPREREVVILRIGWNAQARYEFGQHTLIGRRCGLTDDEILSLTRPVEEPDWSAEDRALIALADELADDDCVSDGTWSLLAERWDDAITWYEKAVTLNTWSQLAERWDDAELVELLVLAGFYRMVSGFLNSAGVQLDDGVPGFPGDATG